MTCSSCQHWSETSKDKGWGYCALADFYAPHKELFFAEPFDGKDARLKTREDFGCKKHQEKYQPEMVIV